MKPRRSVEMAVVVVLLALGLNAAEPGKSTPKGFMDDFEAAKIEAAKSKKNILAVFSGSDWCHWCKVLEKDYLSKPEFVDEAGKDFVLVFVDNPKDKSVLSESAKKANSVLTKKYKIRGFPTIKILNAEGEEIAETRPKDEVTPKDYAVRLRREVKVGPLVKKHLDPLEQELQKMMSDVFAGVMKQAEAEKASKKGEELEKSMFAIGQKAMAGLLEKVKAFRAKVDAVGVPGEITEEKAAFLKKIDKTASQIEQSLKTTWEDMTRESS